MTATKALRRLFSILLGTTFLTLVLVYWPYEIVEAEWATEWPRWSFRNRPGLTAVAGTAGGTLAAGGIALFVYCTVLFGRKGSGTPVPTDPPERLVVSGPFRWTRNPMYLAYVAILLGEALILGRTALLLYAAACALGFHVLALGEEFLLLRRFGERYERYAREVPRWIGLRPLPTGRTDETRREQKSARQDRRPPHSPR